MNQIYDVAVVGAGIAGVSTALHLQMRGKKVLLIDRRDAGQETSYGNAGNIQTYAVLPAGVPPLKNIPKILLNRDTAVRVRYSSLLGALPWILNFYWQSRPENRERSGRLMWPLHAASLDEHRFLMHGTGAERHLSSAGRIALYRSKKSFDASAWELDVARDMGVPFEIADVNDMAVLEPHLKPAFYKAVRAVESGRLTNPGAVTAAYAERFVRDGGFFMQADVWRLVQAQDGWSLETSGGNVGANDIVICAGPWATPILRPLGYHFSIGIKRGYHRHYGMSDGANFAHCFIDLDVGYVMAPMEQGYRLVTGVEFAPVDAPPDPTQLARILPYAKQLFPISDPVGDALWCGSRPCMTDSRPVIGAAARHKGLWFNIGHGHSGMTIGPATGRLLAEIMTGAAPFCDPAPYRAERFKC